VASYLANLRATLAKDRTRARAVIQEDIEKMIVHPARSERAKPFARAEVIATGKGLLSGVESATRRRQRTGSTLFDANLRRVRNAADFVPW
jgi:hypothetical protein